MENNKNILRYASCAGFGICLLIEARGFVSFLGDMGSYYNPIIQFITYVLGLAAYALLIAAIITSKQMLLVVGGAVGALGEFVSAFFFNLNIYYIRYNLPSIFIQLLWMAAWIVIILIGLKGKQYGKILGIISGALVFINRILSMIRQNMLYGSVHYSFVFFLYPLGFIAGVVLLGLVADSFPFAESAAIGASGKYGADAPNRQYRQYRRYDASAPGGAGPQNYQAPGGGAAPYNYQGPGGAGQQNYQGPGGGSAPYNYQGPGPQNYQAPGGGSAPYNYQGAGQQNYQGAGPQNYQASGGGPAPYNYQGAGPQNYQAPDGGSAPYNYQAPGGGAAPQNNTAPDGGAASDDNSAQDSASPFSYYPGGSDDDSSLKK